MYSDSITARAAEFVKLMESERGSLLTAQAPIGLVVVDVLRAIGLPENALAMVIDHDTSLEFQALGRSRQESNNIDQEAKCAYCEGWASNLVESPAGPVFACLDCVVKAEEIGREVIA